MPRRISADRCGWSRLACWQCCTKLLGLLLFYLFGMRCRSRAQQKLFVVVSLLMFAEEESPPKTCLESQRSPTFHPSFATVNIYEKRTDYSPHCKYINVELSSFLPCVRYLGVNTSAMTVVGYRRGTHPGQGFSRNLGENVRKASVGYSEELQRGARIVVERFAYDRRR